MLLKDRFLKKMLLKRAKLVASFFFFFFFFYCNWKQFQVFKIAKFEFKVSVHYGLWAKSTQLWALNIHTAYTWVLKCKEMRISVNDFLRYSATYWNEYGNCFQSFFHCSCFESHYLLIIMAILNQLKGTNHDKGVAKNWKENVGREVEDRGYLDFPHEPSYKHYYLGTMVMCPFKTPIFRLSCSKDQLLPPT